MINTSAAYKEAIKKNRVLHHEAKIEFTDGTTLTPQDQDLYTFKISENTSNENSFDIGSAIAKQLELKINNIDGEYSKHKFAGAKITARVGLEVSGKTEWLKKGVFYADPGKTSGDTISVTAVDSMTKFDVPYSSSKLKYPATLGNIVRDACSVCGVTMSADIASFEQSDFVVTRKPSDSSLNFRNVLQFVGEIACLNFKMNENDQLTASWYDINLLESKTPDDAAKIEYYSGTIETDDVVVTGVKVIEESVSDSDTDSEENETEYIHGSTGYVLEIKENKLIQDGTGASIAEYVGRKVNGVTFRPLSIHVQGDPAVEAGDIAVITDRKGNKYKTILTGVTYTAKAQQDLICGAESPAEQSAVRYSKATQVYRELRKTVSRQRTEFEKALEALNTAMGEKKGLYPITETLEDGSLILYFCDQPTVEESKVVVKLNASGWAMSTDGGKTWNVGALVDGTMITKILNTIGINADWIDTGAIEVKTENGEIIFRVDMDTKSVYMSGSVQIGGKRFSDTIADAVTDSKNYADAKLADYSETVVNSLGELQNQIDGQIETYYYEYEPTLQNIPASQWITMEERKKHEGDLFFWKPNKETGEGGYAYRFFYDSSVSKWEWILVQDTDITKALAAAQNAQDTADGKRRTFIVTPYPPYDIGDTWNQENGDILTCVVARASGTSYVSTDWRKLNKYTDDTVAEEAKRVAEQAKEAAALAKNMILILTNDSQSITVDCDGKYNTFPTTVTQATVMYGSTDISTDCDYEVTKSTGITGNWNKNSRTYTVTGLTEDNGWIDIKATYINLLTVTKRFTVQKIYAGKDGIQGLQGEKGDQGIPGTPGQDGKTQYTHIAYANSADGKTDFSVGNSNREYVGMYADFSETDSTDPSKYHWTLIKGADGKQGIQGAQGADGKTPYFHTAYANSADGKTDFSIDNSTNKAYIGHYTDYTQADSTDYSKYTWVKIKGDPGVAGRTYFLRANAELLLMGADKKISPTTLTISAYYRDGQDEAKSLYGYWKVEKSSDNGNSYSEISTVYTTSMKTIKVAVNTMSLAAHDMIRVSVYTDANKTVLCDRQSFSVVIDVAALTQEDIVNILSADGAWKGLYYSAGHLYISFDAAKGGTLILGGTNNGNGTQILYNAEGKRVSKSDNNGTLYYKTYTDENNYTGFLVNKSGISYVEWANGTETLTPGIVDFAKNRVNINVGLYTEGCSMGKNITTSGTLYWYDWEQQSLTEKTGKKQPVASMGGNGNRVAYIGTGTGAPGAGDTRTLRRLAIRGQWGSTAGYATDYLYTNTQASDIRLKDDVNDSKVNALEIVNKMQVRQFDWKEGGHQDIGFVADELEEIDPNLAFGGGWDENGEMDIKQINTQYLLNYAIKAIQELSGIVENQNKRIEELERRLS